MSAIVTPTPTTKSSTKPFYLVAAVFVAALVVVMALAIGAWATGGRGGSATPTRGNVISTVPSPQSVNALSPALQSVNVSPKAPSVQSVNAASPELPDSAIADWARAEGLTGLSAASLHQSANASPNPPLVQSVNAASPALQSVNVSPPSPRADTIARSATAAECRLTGPC